MAGCVALSLLKYDRVTQGVGVGVGSKSGSAVGEGVGRSAGKEEDEELEPGCKVGSGSRKGWLLGSSIAWMPGASLVMYW